MIRRALRLAFVPEQVNIPIWLSLDIAKDKGLDIIPILVPEGTGKMLDMLENNGADLALTVTDAFIVARSKGRNVQLCGTYVSSPLIWAVASGIGLTSQNSNKIKSFDELCLETKQQNKPLRFGISRLGSGSHTMARYAASLHGLEEHQLEFEIANNFSGLKQGAQDELFDAFLWETFTTKPSFDNNEIYKIGEVPTPWSAFSFVAPSSSLDTPHMHDVNNHQTEMNDSIKHILFPSIKQGIESFIQNSNNNNNNNGEPPVSIQRIMSEYGHTEADARQWLSTCHYSSSNDMAVDYHMIQQSLHILKQVGLVHNDFVMDELWSSKDEHNNYHSNSIITISSPEK
eukprot:gene15786-21380_t